MVFNPLHWSQRNAKGTEKSTPQDHPRVHFLPGSGVLCRSPAHPWMVLKAFSSSTVAVSTWICVPSALVAPGGFRLFSWARASASYSCRGCRPGELAPLPPRSRGKSFSPEVPWENKSPMARSSRKFETALGPPFKRKKERTNLGEESIRASMILLTFSSRVQW